MSFVFKHPSYYKRIRDANKDQAISKESPTGENQRAPGPGLKQQASEDSTANSTRGRVEEPGAASYKLDRYSIKDYIGYYES